LTPEQTVDLLTLVQSFDRRTVGEADVTAWHLAVGDLPFADSQEAVIAHYRDSREWLMPADIRHRVKETRQERLNITPVPPAPPDVAADPNAYREWYRDWRKRIADGEFVRPAIGGTAALEGGEDQ
jgi:hypothetical protein